MPENDGWTPDSQSASPSGLALHDAELAQIAERVSALLQLDRMRPNVPTQVDMRPLANIPAYLSSVFREANALDADLSPNQLYELINRRISDVQAQVYLLRLEMDNRLERDPAGIYEDPLVVSAYGERLATSILEPRSFKFEPSLIAYGWHQAEGHGESFWRWMRPGPGSIVCLPHLGKLDQLIEVRGRMLEVDQLPDLEIRSGDVLAEIDRDPARPDGFVARLRLPMAQVQSASLLPIEFRMTDFREPPTSDTRLLGACVMRFKCSPVESESGDTSE